MKPTRNHLLLGTSAAVVALLAGFGLERLSHGHASPGTEQGLGLARRSWRRRRPAEEGDHDEHSDEETQEGLVVLSPEQIEASNILSPPPSAAAVAAAGTP
ncbi:MAG: hypothetical protein R3F10_05875 [Lysobacteraceae bacterium]